MAPIGDILDQLTTSEKSLLRSTWAVLVSQKEQCATRIFQMIFELCPEAKAMFRFPKSDYDRKTNKSAEFKFHALRFMQVVETAIECLDEAERLQPVILNLGRVHVKIKDQRGFKPYYWSVFVECSLYHIRRLLELTDDYDERMDEIVVLWRILLMAIVKTMTDSFYIKQECNRRNHKQRHSGVQPPAAPLDVTFRLAYGGGAGEPVANGDAPQQPLLLDVDHADEQHRQTNSER